MAGFDIFHNPTRNVPKSDDQIVRVNMQELEIGGRKSALPKNDSGAPGMTIRHIGNNAKG
jgi:hypothetical protein